MLKPVWRDIFAPGGELLREGETIHRTALSRTLAAIAEGGADAFYKVYSRFSENNTIDILITSTRRGPLPKP